MSLSGIYTKLVYPVKNECDEGRWPGNEETRVFLRRMYVMFSNETVPNVFFFLSILLFLYFLLLFLCSLGGSMTRGEPMSASADERRGVLHFFQLFFLLEIFFIDVCAREAYIHLTRSLLFWSRCYVKWHPRNS